MGIQPHGHLSGRPSGHDRRGPLGGSQGLVADGGASWHTCPRSTPRRRRASFEERRLGLVRLVDSENERAWGQGLVASAARDMGVTGPRACLCRIGGIA